jgi:hypothetical protein
VACSSRSKRSSKKQKCQFDLSPEQQVQQLVQQVQDIAGQLLHTPMYSALTSAMQQAAQGGFRSHSAINCSNTFPEQQQQQQSTDTLQSSSSNSSCLKWDWQAVQQLVVYGLGSPEGSRVSRYQVNMGIFFIGMEEIHHWHYRCFGSSSTATKTSSTDRHRQLSTSSNALSSSCCCCCCCCLLPPAASLFPLLAAACAGAAPAAAASTRIAAATAAL